MSSSFNFESSRLSSLSAMSRSDCVGAMRCSCRQWRGASNCAALQTTHCKDQLHAPDKYQIVLSYRCKDKALKEANHGLLPFQQNLQPLTPTYENWSSTIWSLLILSVSSWIDTSWFQCSCLKWHMCLSALHAHISLHFLLWLLFWLPVGNAAGRILRLAKIFHRSFEHFKSWGNICPV